MTGPAKTTQAGTEGPSATSSTGLLQRRCSACSERGSEPGSERDAGRGGAAHAARVPAAVYDVLRQPGQALDAGARAFMGRGFGHDFSHVRVHTDAAAADSARQVNALAYTVGNHVVFAPGQYAPGTTAGRRLLAHELAHTIQQSGGGARPQTKLRVSSAGDPAEAAADAAADAVVRGGSPAVPLAPMPLALNREEGPGPAPGSGGPRRLDLFPPSIFETVPRPSGYRILRVENTADEDVKRVHLDNGQRYRVRRVRWISRRPGGGRAPFARPVPGIDRQRVWMELEWCSNRTEGRIRVGANVPEQVINFVVNSVTSGGDIDSAVSRIRITPYSEAELRVGRWRFTAGAETTIDVEGNVTGAGGRVGVETDTPAGRVGVRGRLGSQRVGEDPLGGLQGGIEIVFTPGTSPSQEPGCRLQRETLVENFRYECQLERDIPARTVQRTRQVPRRETTTRFIYFDHALPRINRQRSADNLSALEQDLRQGYRVVGVRGFTSPEGPREPGRRFEGNIELSRRRAAAALTEAQTVCGRVAGADQTCTEGEVTPRGLSELYTLSTITAEGVEQEVEGPELGRHATERFLAEESEAPHRTEAFTRRFERARTTRARTELVYEMLRRAAIDLARTRTVTETYSEEIPARVETVDVMGGCPADIINRAFPEAARR